MPPVVGRRSLRRSSSTLCERRDPPAFLLWGAKAQAFFAAAKPPAAAPRVLTARHPSYDFRREFMADASHFALTQELVDWWLVDRD